jgi:hypothetical protein
VFVAGHLKKVADDDDVWNEYYNLAKLSFKRNKKPILFCVHSQKWCPQVIKVIKHLFSIAAIIIHKNT